MKYITISDLSDTIRKNIWKIPRDIDFIIGVPRSGMIAASMISSYLNVPLIDVNAYVAGIQPYGGGRLNAFARTHIQTNKALVIDDTVYGGSAMYRTRQKLQHIHDMKFTYMCVYLEGIGENMIDLYLEDVRQYTNEFTEIVIYEWNIFQHHERQMAKCLFDIDGVLCVDPPDERNEEEYINYITNATPLFTPRNTLGGIITYRLVKNQEITTNWLHKNGITYYTLTMFHAQTWQERHDSGITPEQHKGLFYKDNDQFQLFVESDDNQAKKIASIAKKPVYCVESNKLYK